MQAANAFVTVTLITAAAGRLGAADAVEGAKDARAFYVRENPKYTIVDSAVDSARFTVEKTLTRCSCGHLSSISSFVDENARIMSWHDFGPLEGPGWAANAVGGAYEIDLLADLLDRPAWRQKALGILDHVLDHGFIDEKTGFITGYRRVPDDRFVLDFRSNDDWFCPGSMAKVAFQLLAFADRLPQSDPRRERMGTTARRCAAWIREHVESAPNGWYPRRTTRDGRLYRKSCTGGDDPFFETSADGLFIVQLMAALTERGLEDYRAEISRRLDVFRKLGGIFGSINHDTYDAHESVAYAVAFRTLLAAANVLGDDAIRRFAFDTCLDGLDQFRMCEDRNGVATRGLLYMEKSWDTAYLWENAEAALACFEAAADMRRRDAAAARERELDGLVILRAIAKHHVGDYGFLTEGVDWNNHVGQQHHVGGARFGAIRYTEPFLNNQHIIEPTVWYIEHLARRRSAGDAVEYLDIEDNVILRRAKEDS